MAHVHTRIAVSGFTEGEIASGLTDFLAELSARPWLMNPDAAWDAGRRCLVVSVHTLGSNPQHEADAVLDEVWDGVAACFRFSADRIGFSILEARLVLRPE